MCFSKRAILRIGMLLRDSKVAQEVRTQLLNTFENASDKIKTQDIDEELNCKQLIQAYMTDDSTNILLACKNIDIFRKKTYTKTGKR